MKKPALLRVLLFAFALTLSGRVFATSYPAGSAKIFMQGETNNSYVPASTVKEEFRPQFGKTFPIKYLEIPEDLLHVVDSGDGDASVRAHFFVMKNGRRHVRFFIHPDSEHLYEPLVKKYGVAGTYSAAATASTRSLLAWPDSDPKALVFLKLSLAQIQDGLGRIIPGWEVRRSVGISEIAAQTSDVVWKESGASIIPEFAGAYVDTSAALPFYVDAKQGNVFEHGLIGRSAEFLNEYPDDITVPLFSLFSAGPKGEESLIIELWKKQNAVSKISFVDFVGEFLFRPFLEKNKYLLFHQGIIPEFHGQNVVVVLDKNTKRIKHFFHRDVGSMKVDLRLRWAHGLAVDSLRTPNAQFDFKFVRAPTSIEDNLVNYLNDWLFRWTYLKEIRKTVAGFSPSSTEKLLLKMARETLRDTLPLRSGQKFEKLADHLEAYYAENPPESLGAAGPAGNFNKTKIENFISAQIAASQTVPLPAAWSAKFSALPLVTEYGIVFKSATGGLQLALHASNDLVEIRESAKSYVRTRRVPTRRIGYVTGTFDPPHRGHEQMIRNAIAQLGLDAVIVVPNFEPGHKPGAQDFSRRRAFTEAAFRGIPQVIVADESTARAVADGGMTVHLNKYAAAHPDLNVVQIMGSDSLDRFKQYGSRYEKNISIAVETRETGYKVPKKLNGTEVLKLKSTPTGISSTEIREALARGETIAPELMHPNVVRMIEAAKLYRVKGAPACRTVFSKAG